MKHIILFIFISLVFVNANAQAVGIGTTNPNNSSMLEISSNNKGLLLPRLTDTSSVSSPAKGLVIFSNKNNKLWYFDGNHWQQAVSNAGGMDSIWFKAKDSMVYTPKEYVGINTNYNLISPRANMQVNGTFLVQKEPDIYSTTAPTPSQVYTMNNTSSQQFILNADSVFRIYDPSGPNNSYTTTMQGNIQLNTIGNWLGTKISSVSADFGFGTGDTLWISYREYPECRTEYVYRFTNTIANPPDFIINSQVLHFVFRSNNDGSNGKGFNFLCTRLYGPLYEYDSPKKILPMGHSLYFSTTDGSFAAGTNCEASNLTSIAIGYVAKATGNAAIALGNRAEANGSNSVALGRDSKSDGVESFASGSGWAMGDYSNALGGGQATGFASITVGGGYSSGAHSVAIGYNAAAKGNYSIATGYGSDATGNISTAMGYFTEASGATSTSLGYQTIARGANSTVIGMYNNAILGSPQSTATPSTAMLIVGNGDDDGNRSNAMVVLKSGNVGIGTNFPDDKLSVQGDMTLNNTAGGTTINLESNFAQKGFVQLSGDNLRLGTYSSNDAGTVIFRLNGADRFTINPNGNATLTGTLTQNSDAKFKDGIVQIDNALNKVMQLNGYRYHWKPELKRDSSTQLGLIAQNVEAVFPELVSTNKEGDKSVAYQNMVAVLIEAIKEQQKLIASLKNEMAEMKKLVGQK